LPVLIQSILVIERKTDVKRPEFQLRILIEWEGYTIKDCQLYDSSMEDLTGVGLLYQHSPLSYSEGSNLLFLKPLNNITETGTPYGLPGKTIGTLIITLVG
jgi:hypothetical protein